MGNNTNKKSFKIVGIYIHESCAKRYRKILSPGYYPLDNSWKYDEEKKDIEENKEVQQLDPDFFGKNISISAIVGENGSGKSTFLDFMYT